MAKHQYKKCTSATCEPCQGLGEVTQGDGSKTCDFCGGAGRSHCGGCRAEGMDCWYDALSFCDVCGGMEGSLLPDCPGVSLTPEEHDANYQHFCAGTMPDGWRGPSILAGYEYEAAVLDTNPKLDEVWSAFTR